MKTTLEIPDALYREAKTVAAKNDIKMKDLFARGLQMAIEVQNARGRYPTPLQSFSLVRESPLHTAEEIRAMIEETDRSRKAGWESAKTS
jgi:hypothetical protein